MVCKVGELVYINSVSSLLLQLIRVLFSPHNHLHLLLFVFLGFCCNWDEMEHYSLTLHVSDI